MARQKDTGFPTKKVLFYPKKKLRKSKNTKINQLNLTNNLARLR